MVTMCIVHALWVTHYTRDRYPQAEKPATHFSTFGFSDTQIQRSENQKS